jgi:hypothetical protein
MGCSLFIEHIVSMCEVIGLISSTTRKKEYQYIIHSKAITLWSICFSICVALALHYCNKYLRWINLKRGSIYFGSFSIWLIGLVVSCLWQGSTSWQGAYSGANCSPNGQDVQKRKRPGFHSPLQEPVLHVLKPSTMLYLLKFLSPPRAPSWVQVLNTWAFGGHSRSKL